MDCAIIAAYNEEKTIKEVVKRTFKYVDRVIVADDGSTDNTTSILRKMKNKKLKLVKLKTNQGKTKALVEAIKTLPKNTKNVYFLDGDLQHLPKEIPLFRKKLAKYDFVIGERFNERKHRQFHKGFLNKVIAILFSIYLGKKINDALCGYRGIKYSSLKKMDLSGGGLSIEIIMLIEAKKNNIDIDNMSITCIYYPNRKAKIRIVKHGLLGLKDILHHLMK